MKKRRSRITLKSSSWNSCNDTTVTDGTLISSLLYGSRVVTSIESHSNTAAEETLRQFILLSFNHH